RLRQRRDRHCDRTQIINSPKIDETSKENGATRAQSRASQSVARQSGLQFDRASADQDHACESESGPPPRRKNGDARQEWLDPRATKCLRDSAPERRGGKVVRSDRACLE